MNPCFLPSSCRVIPVKTGIHVVRYCALPKTALSLREKYNFSYFSWQSFSFNNTDVSSGLWLPLAVHNDSKIWCHSPPIKALEDKLLQESTLTNNTL
jgi:hypothetical protein